MVAVEGAEAEVAEEEAEAVEAEEEIDDDDEVGKEAKRAKLQ